MNNEQLIINYQLSIINYQLILAVETTRQLLQRSEPPQRTGLATQAKPASAGYKIHAGGFCLCRCDFNRLLF